MKKPKSTKNKDNKSKFEFNADTKEERSKKDDAEAKNSEKAKGYPNFYEENEADELEISSNSEESPQNNALGFLQMNTLTHNVKERMNETQHVGFHSDRKDPKSNLNPKGKDIRGRLRESQSIGPKKINEEDVEDQNKDSMIVDKGKEKFNPWETAHDWNNQSLDPSQDVEIKSKKTKMSKNSKIGSRDGSKRGRRKIKAIVALQQKREKTNISRQGKRKIVKNKNNPISFDEFKQDDKFNKEIGANEDELEKAKPLDINFDPNEIIINESHLDEESFNFTPFDRSVSIVSENVKEGQDEFVHENPIEIVEQNSFDKFENYKDKLPCLHLRKSLLRIKRIINKSALTIISNPIFDYSCLCVIIANSIALSMYDPLNPTASDTGFLGSLDTVFLA